MKPKQISTADLRTLGIDEKKFNQLKPKEQKEFLQLHALEESSILKARTRRKRPDLSIPRKTSFRYILSYLWVPYKVPFSVSVVLSVVQAVLFVGLPLMVEISINDLVNTQNFGIVLRDFGFILLLMARMKRG